MYPIELSAQIEEWREKAKAGTLTEEECIQAIAALRKGNRAAAAVGSTKAKSAKAAKTPDATALLNQLEGL